MQNYKANASYTDLQNIFTTEKKVHLRLQELEHPGEADELRTTGYSGTDARQLRV